MYSGGAEHGDALFAGPRPLESPACQELKA